MYKKKFYIILAFLIILAAVFFIAFAEFPAQEEYYRPPNIKTAAITIVSETPR